MSKSTIVAVLIFVGLLCGVYLVRQQPAEKGISRISFTGLDTEAIDALTLEGKETVALKKEGEAWTLEGQPAAEVAVKALLSSLKEIQSTDLITTKTQNYATYEVGDENGHHVVAYQGEKVVADLVVGKSQAGSTYVRVEDGVYRVSGTFSYAFARARPQWFELKLFEEKIEAITRVVLGPPGAGYTLEKNDTVWGLAEGTALPEGFRFDPNAARSRVSGLLSLRARELLTEDPGEAVTGLGEDAAKVSFFVDEAETVLRLGANKEGDETVVYAKVEGREVIYLLNQANTKTFLAPVTKLRELTLIALDPAKVSALEIVSGKERLWLKKGEAGWSLARSSTPAPEGFELDPARVEQRLGALKTARALGLLEDTSPGAAGLSRPAATITATLEGGEKVALRLGAEREEDGQTWVPAMGNIDDALYRLSPYLKKTLTGGLDTFKKVAAPQGAPGGGMGMLDPSMMQGLPPEVREALMKKQREQAAMKKLAAQLPPSPPPGK